MQLETWTVIVWAYHLDPKRTTTPFGCKNCTKGFYCCYNHLRVYYLSGGSCTLLAGQECMVLFRACSCPDLVLWDSVHEHSKIHICVLASLNYQHKDRKDGLPVCGLQVLCPPFELKLQPQYDITVAKHHLSQRSKYQLFHCKNPPPPPKKGKKERNSLLTSIFGEKILDPCCLKMLLCKTWSAAITL